MKKVFGFLLAFALVLGVFAMIPRKAFAADAIVGDMNGDGVVTDADAIHLLYHTFFPDEYPLNQSGDMNQDGSVTDADAIHLLYHTFFPDEYPLPEAGSTEEYDLEEDELEPIFRGN